MGRPLRDRDPESFRLITIRTEEERFFLTPDESNRQLIGGIIARYQEIFGILIYAIAFLSDHYHMIIKAPRENADEFLENVDREIARRVNWKLDRQGKFWSRRPDDQKILSEADLLQAFLYVTNNMVRHGLERRAANWTGLSSYRQSVTEEPEEFTFYRYSLKDESKRATRHRLTISPLPQFAHMEPVDRKKLIRELIEESATEYIQSREKLGQGFLTMAIVKDQSPFDRPEAPARSRRPTGYTKNKELRKNYRAERSHVRQLYTQASQRYRLGDLNVLFPTHTFKPQFIESHDLRSLKLFPTITSRKLRKHTYERLDYRCHRCPLEFRLQMRSGPLRLQ